MNPVNARLKSKTYWYSMALALLTTIQANLPLVQDFLKDHFNTVMFLNLIVITVLRELTARPVGEKQSLME